MPLIASDVMLEAASVYLNDRARAHYDDTVLLPYLKKAYKDLQLEMFLQGSVVLEETSSAALLLPALSVSMTDSAILPSDLIEPVEVFERVGINDAWEPLGLETWEPTTNPVDFQYLNVYTWREQDIKFRGCNRAMYVMLHYRKELSSITGANSAIAVFNSSPYLSAKTAFYAAGFGGGNTTRAQAALSGAETALSKLNQVQVRENQHPVRRLPYGSRRRRRRG